MVKFKGSYRSNIFEDYEEVANDQKVFLEQASEKKKN